MVERIPSTYTEKPTPRGGLIASPDSSHVTVMGSTKPLGVRENFQKNPVVDFSKSLDTKTKKAITGELRRQYLALQQDLNKTKKENGFIGKSWDWIKNTTGWGQGSDKTQKDLDALKGQINELEKHPENLGKAYKNITGKDLNAKELERFKKGEIALKAKETVDSYKEGQKASVETVADLTAGIVSFGAYTVAALGLAAAPFTGGASLVITAGAVAVATGAGAAIKMGIKYADTTSGGREYDSAGYDAITGGVNGLLAPITAGIGGAVSKTLAARFGLQVVKEGAEVVAEQGVKEVAVQTVKTGGKSLIEFGNKYTGGNLFTRGLTYTAESVTIGATSGAPDAYVRNGLTTGHWFDENAAVATGQGLMSGALTGLLMDGGFRVAGKAGKKISGFLFKGKTEVVADATASAVEHNAPEPSALTPSPQAPQPSANNRAGTVKSVQQTQPRAEMPEPQIQPQVVDNIANVDGNAKIDIELNSPDDIILSSPLYKPFGRTSLTQGYDGITTRTNADGNKEVVLIKIHSFENKDKLAIRYHIDGQEIDKGVVEINNGEFSSYNGLKTDTPQGYFLVRSGVKIRGKNILRLETFIQTMVEESYARGFGGRVQTPYCNAQTAKTYIDLGFKPMEVEPAIIEKFAGLMKLSPEEIRQNPNILYDLKLEELQIVKDNPEILSGLRQSKMYLENRLQEAKAFSERDYDALDDVSVYLSEEGIQRILKNKPIKRVLEESIKQANYKLPERAKFVKTPSNIKSTPPKKYVIIDNFDNPNFKLGKTGYNTAHGDIVRGVINASDPDAHITTIPINGDNIITVDNIALVKGEVEKILEAAKRGEKVDGINLSWGTDMPISEIPNNLHTSSFNSKNIHEYKDKMLEGLDTEANRLKAKGADSIDVNSAMGIIEIIGLINKCEDAGIPVFIAGSNSGPNGFNMFLLSKGRGVKAVDLNGNETMYTASHSLTPETALGDYPVKFVEGENGGVSLLGDTQADIPFGRLTKTDEVDNRNLVSGTSFASPRRMVELSYKNISH